MHWADVLAKEVLTRTADKYVFATAITPSGPIHVGNMREVLTTDAVYRAVKKLGVDAELIYIGDTYDPLRKVYPFLKKEEYEQHVGKPLSDIPCSCGSHSSYADHFLEPFLQNLEELGVAPRILHAHEMYRSGMYVESVKQAMDSTPLIRQIMIDVAKREGKLPENWIPFNVQCSNCLRLNGPIPTLYEYPYIEYTCQACKHEGKKDIREPGGGKLPWRLDWPARWKFLGVTFEAMGKDHAAAGSSWDTGVEFVTRVFGAPPPVRTVYEFVQVKGVGAMHSSTGTAVSATEMLNMTPAEVLRFLFMRYQPNKHIDFDTGSWVVDLVNEYDRFEQAYFQFKDIKAKDPTAESEKALGAQYKDIERVYELSQPYDVPTKAPPAVPYNHLVLLAQIAPTWEGVRDILQRTELISTLTPEEERHLKGRVEHARYWLSNFAPADAKSEIQQAFPTEAVARLDAAQKAYLAALHGVLENAKWTGEAIHNAIYDTAKARELPGGKAFQALYESFLAKSKGPRAGFFLASLDRQFVLDRLKAAGQ